METGNLYSYNSVITLLQNPNVIKDIMGYITTVSEDNYTYMGVRERERERAHPHTHICELNGVQQKLPPFILHFTLLLLLSVDR